MATEEKVIAEEQIRATTKATESQQSTKSDNGNSDIIWKEQ